MIEKLVSLGETAHLTLRPAPLAWTDHSWWVGQKSELHTSNKTGLVQSNFWELCWNSTCSFFRDRPQYGPSLLFNIWIIVAGVEKPSYLTDSEESWSSMPSNKLTHSLSRDAYRSPSKPLQVSGRAEAKRPMQTSRTVSYYWKLSASVLLCMYVWVCFWACACECVFGHVHVSVLLGMCVFKYITTSLKFILKTLFVKEPKSVTIASLKLRTPCCSHHQSKLNNLIDDSFKRKIND